MTTHFNPLGHISIGVRDHDVSKAFYSATLAPLGLKLVYDSEAVARGKTPRTLGFGPNEEHELVNIFEYGTRASPPGPGFHIAFDALSRQAVRDFYEAALRSGGSSNGEPGLRSHYGRNYYAAFVIDPDGWRLEAVCKAEDETTPSEEIASACTGGH